MSDATKTTALGPEFTRAVERLVREPGGVCVAASILANIGGPGIQGTQNALRRHGIKPTGDRRADIRAHLDYHGLGHLA